MHEQMLLSSSKRRDHWQVAGPKRRARAGRASAHHITLTLLVHSVSPNTRKPLAQRSVTPLVERSVESSTNSRHLSSGGWFQALSSTPSILPNAWCGYAPARAPTPVREHTHTTTHTRSKVQTSVDLACYAKPCVAAFASECLRCCGARKSKRPPSRRSRASERASPARTNDFRTQRIAAAM